jgi:DNA modification methylase
VNHLYYGDNLTIMQRMPKWSVDLIYLDPPFNSKQTYNLIYKNMTGKPVPDQAEAFCDTWDMDSQKEEIARSMPILMREHGIADYYVEFWRLWINALRHTQPHLLAYLIYIVQRMLYMRSLLRPTGSIYLHCDPTASHYIKVMMDGIFGHDNFRNEIIWKRQSAHSDAKLKFSSVTDSILYYGQSRATKFYPQYGEHDPSYLEKFYRFDDLDGRGRYRLGDMSAPKGGGMAAINKATGKPNGWHIYKGYEPPSTGWRYSPETMARLDSEGRIYFPRHKDGTPDLTKRLALKRYLREQEGSIITNIWTDIPPVQASESFGYPTQKPIALLERIISASTEKGQIVFDPFCGCGTTIYAAEKLGRQWIGCDVAILSIKLIREILTGEKFRLVEGHAFDVNGIPVSVEQAQELFKRDPFQFEHWIVERVGGFPTKKTGDKGIDGRMYFETKEGLKAMVLSVKGGHLRPTDVRDLRGVLADQTDTEMAGFLSLQEPSKAMREAASLAGQFEYGGVKYDRMQFLTVKDILEEKREFHTPTKMISRVSSAQGSLAL